MSYLTRIIKIENGQAVFSNEISDVKAIGEIRLQKSPMDNICNICVTEQELTSDHVPPKCTGNKGLFHYVNLYNYMLYKNIEYKGISQDGIKYQTICRKCNNEILKQFDDEINILYSTLKTVGKSNRLILKLTIKPNKIIRGILGHFLSAKTSHIRTLMEDIFAEAIKYPLNPIDKSLGFYVVPYFYSQVRIIRDLVVDYNRVIINCMKIYPLAFIVTQPKCFPKLPDWSNYFDVPSETEYDVEFFGVKECDLEWPERYFHPTVFGKNGVESIIGFPDNNRSI